VAKGAICMIDVSSTNVYQLVPYAHIRENIEKAQKCAAYFPSSNLFFMEKITLATRTMCIDLLKRI